MSNECLFFKNFLITLEDSIFEEPISVINVFEEIKLLIFKISFLYSLIGVQKIINSVFKTASCNLLTKIPGNFNFLIFFKFLFDFS